MCIDASETSLSQSKIYVSMCLEKSQPNNIKK